MQMNLESMKIIGIPSNLPKFNMHLLNLLKINSDLVAKTNSRFNDFLGSFHFFSAGT